MVDRTGVCEETRTVCPPLPRSCFTRKHTLSKAGGHGWGLVLRGTSCELEGNLKAYTCLVEDVTEGGEAQVNTVNNLVRPGVACMGSKL